MVDALDHAEKAVKKKAAAAEMEQPEQEVKHGKWWYGPNFTKAKLKIKLSGKASILADYIYSHYIEGMDWDFQNWHAIEETGLSIDTIQNAKTELIDKNVVKREIVKNNKGQFGSWRYPFNPDFETWKTITGKTIKGKSINGKPAKGKTIKGKPGNINIEEDKVGRDLNMEERERVAAEPPPAPAFSAPAAPAAPAPHTAKSASQESSFPETAQGQTNLWGEPERVPEKPKKKPKGKGKAAGNAKQKFSPPTHDQVAARVKNRVDNKGFSAKWTLYQINETATRIIAHYTMTGWTYGKNQTPMKSWEGAVDGWLSRSNYLPEMPDISTTDTLQQPQQRQQGQRKSEADILAILNRGNTSQETFEAESVRITQN